MKRFKRIFSIFSALVLLWSQILVPVLAIEEVATSSAAVQNLQEPSPSPEPSPVPSSTPSPVAENITAETSTPSANLAPDEPTPSPTLSPEPESPKSASPSPSPTPEPSNTASPAATLNTDNKVVQGSLTAIILHTSSDPSTNLDLGFGNQISSASLTTDKTDYAPTETVLISGTGFQTETAYTLLISSENPPPVNFETRLTTSDNGKFIYSYQLDGKYRPNYKVQSKDSNGNVVAETSFTDTASCTPPPSEMTSWWPGDGNADDIAGTNNGTWVGSETYAEGKVSQAFSFNGTGNWVAASNVGDFGNSPFTVDFWMYANNDGYHLVGKSYADAGQGWDLRLNGNRIQVVGTNGWPAEYNIQSDPVVTSGAWHHIALTSIETGSDPQAVKLYIDGVLRGTGPRSTISYTSNPFRIGYTTNFGGHPFDGLIDEVEIFSRALSQEEIAAIYNADSAGKCKEEAPAAETTIIGYKFNDLNPDGLWDTEGGESGIENWTVALGRVSGKPNDDGQIPIEIVSMSLTSVDGQFVFTGVPSGEYKVFEEQRGGWSSTYPPQGDSFFDIIYGEFDEVPLLQDSFFDVVVSEGELALVVEYSVNGEGGFEHARFGNVQGDGEDERGPDWAEIFGMIRDALSEEGITTNIYDCSLSPTACEGLYFENEFGRVSFPGPLDLTDDATVQTLQSLQDGGIGFNDGEIVFNAQAGDVFGSLGAILEMYDLDFDQTPIISVDGVQATDQDVEGIDYDSETGMLTFTAKHFSTFTVEEALSGLAISTCQQLQDITSDSDYYLANDIDCSGFPFTSILGFNATLDGQNHTISDLTIVETGGNWGLFSGTDGDAVIKNIAIENISMTGSGYAGGIVGWNMGLIQNCSLTGTVVSNYQEVGGIVGSNQGTIENCSVDIDLTGGSYTGGIAGSNKNGQVKNSYVKGTISGGGNSGGIVGLNAYGSLVQNSYSVASVSGGMGALAGWNYDGGSVSNSYWSEELSGVSAMCATDCGNENEKTPAQLKEQSTFSGWDFESLWTIDAGKNSGYPFLQWQTVPYDIQISQEQETTVGTTSITVSWTTDHPATSRVIYDTVSHTELGEAPNYGYANSTTEADSDPKVTSHSVDVSGLTADTTYYYRAISHGSPEAVGDEKSFKTLTLTSTSTTTTTTTTTTNTTGNGTGDGLSDGLGCGSHDCSGNIISAISAPLPVIALELSSGLLENPQGVLGITTENENVGIGETQGEVQGETITAAEPSPKAFQEKTAGQSIFNLKNISILLLVLLFSFGAFRIFKRKSDTL